MEIEPLKLDFYVDFFPLEFYLGTQFLDIRDASFQHCFETWQLTKFFYIYCYLARTIEKKQSKNEKETLKILGIWGFLFVLIIDCFVVNFLDQIL